MKRINWNEFESILSIYNIGCLYHFTDRSNLPSIVANRGLLSWADCEEKGINISRPGGDKSSRIYDRRDNLHYYVRLSFTNQHPMMFVARRDGRITDPVILEIDKDVIFEESTLFSNMNAIKRESTIGGDISDFKRIHFTTVVRKNHFDLSVDEKKFYQAEVLVKNYIPLEKIRNIGNFNLSLPPDILLKNSFGKDKYVYDIDAVDLLSHCLWELKHTTYIQGVCLSTMIFEMFDYTHDLQIFIRGILDSHGIFHLVVSKRNNYGICSISLEHFINLLISLDMLDEGMRNKLSILINQ